jgi:cell division septum initiation protein DivIVA
MRSFEPMPTERAALIARIKAVSFTPTRFRPGYDERAADNFLDAVIASLALPSVPFTAAQIREQVLPQVRVKGGYDIEEFDEFRALIAEAVQLLH